MPKYYCRYLSITLPDGSKKQLKIYGKTEAEADRNLAKKKLEYEMGLLVFNSNTPFARWAMDWAETYKKPKQSPQTYKNMIDTVRRVFFPDIGNIEIGKITTAHLQRCINKLEGKSKSYISKSMTYVKGIMKSAYINNMIAKDPSLGLEAPKGTVKHRRSLNKTEIAAFFAAIDQHPFGLLFGLMLGCGLRPGEARAMTWQNIDLTAKTMRVTAAIAPKTTLPKEPKTEAGKRTIPLPDWLLPLIAKHPKQDSIFLFSGLYGKPITEQRMKRAWKSLLRQMDIAAGAKLYRNEIVIHAADFGWNELTPYYLRHTFCTNLCEAGVDLKTAQYLMGHTDITMTANIYAHITSNMLETARNKINLHSQAYDIVQ